jgi:hypothetical protein
MKLVYSFDGPSFLTFPLIEVFKFHSYSFCSYLITLYYSLNVISLFFYLLLCPLHLTKLLKYDSNFSSILIYIYSFSSIMLNLAFLLPFTIFLNIIIIHDYIINHNHVFYPKKILLYNIRHYPICIPHIHIFDLRHNDPYRINNFYSCFFSKYRSHFELLV